MKDLVKTWGLYPWSIVIARSKEYINPQDLELFQAIYPLGKVFFCTSAKDGYICLSYGEKEVRVKPDLYKVVQTYGYLIGDIVEILNGSSKGKKAKIKEMHWHYKKQEVIYTLEVDEKVKSRRYYQDDFKLLDKS